MNWKEQLNQRAPGILDKRGVIDLERFISTEIIEKLIADIPEPQEIQDQLCFWGNRKLKQQLRDNWL